MTEFSQPCCMTLYPSFPASNTGNTYSGDKILKALQYWFNAHANATKIMDLKSLHVYCVTCNAYKLLETKNQ